ncbi:MAG: hypothetical protein ACRDT4_12195, partial [Micromonosporaceae bacterium]
PYGAPPPSDPYGAPPPSDPYGAPGAPPAPNPYGPPGGSDPYGAPPPQSDPYGAPPSGADPYSAPPASDPYSAPPAGDPYGAPGVSGPPASGPPISPAPDPYGQQPQPGYPAYGAPPSPYATGGGYTPTGGGGNSGMAIGAMVAGIVSVVFGLLGCCLSIIAAIPALLAGGTGAALGFISMRKIDESNGQIGGKGMAITGLATGAVGVLLGLAFTVIFILVATGAIDTSSFD